MIGSGCLGFGRGKLPTDPKASGSVGGDPPPTIEVLVQAVFGSGSGGLFGLVRYMGWVDSPRLTTPMLGKKQIFSTSSRVMVVSSPRKEKSTGIWIPKMNHIPILVPATRHHNCFKNVGNLNDLTKSLIYNFLVHPIRPTTSYACHKDT